MKKKHTYFIVLFTLFFVFGCNKTESHKTVNNWKGTWYIIESTDLPGEKGSKENPLGVMTIDKYGYGQLEYLGEQRDFVLLQTVKTTPSFPFEIRFLKGGGGLEGRAKPNQINRTRNLEYFEKGELYIGQFDNYFNKKNWILKKG